MNKVESKIKFVGLHAHTGVGSPFDGLGYPKDHMDFAYKNGTDALAQTDHGNMNALSFQVEHAKKMKSKGLEFKPIFGVEAYFVPSLDQWREEYEKAKQDKKNSKNIDDSQSGTTIEDEESKKAVKNILNRRRHLILLAQNQVGLNNIFSLVSKSFQEQNFYKYPRMDYKMLEEHSEGVIAASACLGGVYAGNYWENREDSPEAVLTAMRQTTEKMVSIFGDRWYGELQWNNIPEQHELNKYIIQVCDEYGVELISTADSHYPNPDAWKDRELYKRLGWLGKGAPAWAKSTELPVGVEEIGYELYPKNGDQMWNSYKTYSALCEVEYDDKLILESIEKTHNIAFDRIEDFLPDNTVRLPSFVVPEGTTADRELVKLSIEGLKTLKLDKKQEYVDRLKEELDVICDRGFSKYFLTMKAIADKAKKTRLTGGGRGSAAGALTSYVLGITQVDPIKFGLLFSRFMTKDAKDYPDIDFDVASPMEFKEQLIEDWGKNTVVPISNFNKLQLRSLIKDISKFYDIPFQEVNNVTSVMLKEATPIAKKVHGIKAGVYNPTFEEVIDYSESLKKFFMKYPHVKKHVLGLVGEMRSLSRHAGGVVVGENLDSYMPLISSKGVTQTPWSEGQFVRHLEPMGFIKFDLLGLTTLEIFENAIEKILRRHHGIENPTFADISDYYEKYLHPDKIDLNDQEVYKNVFHSGKWAGVFQFTNTGAQNFCKTAKPKNIIDVSSITSIYRPGPLSANVDKNFVEAKENPRSLRYGHDIVKEVTKETYGFLIFQEQIALLAHKLGKDISLDEGNKLRKLLTKKGTGEVAEKKNKIRSKFIAGCLEKGLTEKWADQMWQKFEFFSGYGFNKSHAVCYSIISYQCAWLFNYYPAEWLCAFLDAEPIEKKEAAINIAKSFGYSIKPVNINDSEPTWMIDPDDEMVLIQPFSSLKGMGDAVIDKVMSNRPYNSVEQLLFDKEAKLNKTALNALLRVGALDELIFFEGYSTRKHFWKVCLENRPNSKKKFKALQDEYKDYTEKFSRDEIIENMVEISGLYPISMVVSDEVKKRLDYYKVPPISEWDEELGLSWVIPREVIVKKTAKSNRAYFIITTIDSNSEMHKIRCWGINPDKEKVFVNRPYMVRLQHSNQWGFSTKGGLKDWKMLG